MTMQTNAEQRAEWLGHAYKHYGQETCKRFDALFRDLESSLAENAALKLKAELMREALKPFASIVDLPLTNEGRFRISILQDGKALQFAKAVISDGFEWSKITDLESQLQRMREALEIAQPLLEEELEGRISRPLDWKDCEIEEVKAALNAVREALAADSGKPAMETK